MKHRPFPGEKARGRAPALELTPHELARLAAAQRAARGLALGQDIETGTALRLALAGCGRVTDGFFHAGRGQAAAASLLLL